MPDTFGSRLREARLNKGLMQKSIADVVGVSINSIGLYERGLVEPSFFIATCLADALGVSLDWLAGRETEMEVKHERV